MNHCGTTCRDKVDISFVISAKQQKAKTLLSIRMNGFNIYSFNKKIWNIISWSWFIILDFIILGLATHNKRVLKTESTLECNTDFYQFWKMGAFVTVFFVPDKLKNVTFIFTVSTVESQIWRVIVIDLDNSFLDFILTESLFP